LKRKDKHGITPILAAIWEGHTSCVELLLKMVCVSLFLHIRQINMFSIAGCW